MPVKIVRPVNGRHHDPTGIEARKNVDIHGTEFAGTYLVLEVVGYQPDPLLVEVAQVRQHLGVSKGLGSEDPGNGCPVAHILQYLYAHGSQLGARIAVCRHLGLYKGPQFGQEPSLVDDRQEQGTFGREIVENKSAGDAGLPGDFLGGRPVETSRGE